jgi:hypothetical protein
LRKNFAVRYLQTGGDLCTLWELLGQKESGLFERLFQVFGEGAPEEQMKG